MTTLDLRSINLGDKGILTFATKKAAKQHRIPHLCWITEAANRFWRFYVIVRQTQSGEFQIMRQDGNFFPFENRRWCGDTTYVTE